MEQIVKCGSAGKKIKFYLLIAIAHSSGFQKSTHKSYNRTVRVTFILKNKKKCGKEREQVVNCHLSLLWRRKLEQSVFSTVGANLALFIERRSDTSKTYSAWHQLLLFLLLAGSYSH